MCTVTLLLYRASKTTPNWPLTHQILTIVSKVMIMTFSNSADLYSDPTIALGFKNYPKLTPNSTKADHWIKSYDHCIFWVSWFVKWPHQWIGLQKLPKIDPSLNKIRRLDQKLWSFHFLCQLICTVTSPLDWASKTTPNWPLTH